MLVSRWTPLLASEAHPFDAVSLDLPSDVVRASLSDIPNSLSAKPIGLTHPTTEYCALVGGFMGPLGQILPSD